MALSIAADTQHFVTLGEVKRHANIPLTDTEDDEELGLIQGAAEDAVEGLVGPIRWRTVVETVRVSGSSAVLNTSPVVAVTSVLSGGQTVAATLDAEAGLLSDVSQSGDVVVTYQAGRDSCPDAIRLATLIIATHLWRTQLGNTPSALPDADSFDVQPEFGAGFALPNRAAELLAPYMLLPGVA